MHILADCCIAVKIMGASPVLLARWLRQKNCLLRKTLDNHVGSNRKSDFEEQKIELEIPINELDCPIRGTVCLKKPSFHIW
jgi:DNA mismatch repair protein MutH